MKEGVFLTLPVSAAAPNPNYEVESMTVPAPVAPKASGWSKVLWGVLAAFTTPEAVKAEKSLAAVVLTRLAVLLPSAGFAIDLLVKSLS